MKKKRTVEPGVFYVWSGSLKGVKVEAPNPRAAVDKAVRENLPCVLSEAIRISPLPKGGHELDVYVYPPFEESFPDLFADKSLEIEVRKVRPE